MRWKLSRRDKLALSLVERLPSSIWACWLGIIIIMQDSFLFTGWVRGSSISIGLHTYQGITIGLIHTRYPSKGEKMTTVSGEAPMITPMIAVEAPFSIACSTHRHISKQDSFEV